MCQNKQYISDISEVNLLRSYHQSDQVIFRITELFMKLKKKLRLFTENPSVFSQLFISNQSDLSFDQQVQ